MVRKYLLPAMAFIGLVFAFLIVIQGMRKPSTPKIEFPPPIPPYKHFVAGSGIIEATSQEISIGVPFSEIVTKIFVKVGDYVQKDTPLFQLDTSSLISELHQAEKDWEAKFVNYQDQKKQLNLYQNLNDKNAVSQDDFNQRFYAAEIAFKQAEEAKAGIQVIETNIYRSTIRAPLSGHILQLNVRLGESVEINPFDNTAPILFGSTSPLHIRVEIDEEDAWRVRKNAKGMAYVRGNRSLFTPLKFLYIEPYMVPKTSLTGDNKQRVDTRVLQIVYEIEKKDLPIYVGQIMDVYIKALPSDEKF